MSRPVWCNWKEDTPVSTASETAERANGSGSRDLAVEAEYVTQSLVVIIEVASICSSKECTLAAVSLKYSPWNWVSNCAIGWGWCYIFNTSSLPLPDCCATTLADSRRINLGTFLSSLERGSTRRTLVLLPTGYCKNVIEGCVEVQIRVEHHVEDFKNASGHLNDVFL